MTKEEYLKSLEENLQALSTEERDEALCYYKSYFEDAGDDEKAAFDLGEPEDLAKAILDKIAGVPAEKEQADETESDEANGGANSEGFNAEKIGRAARETAEKIGEKVSEKAQEFVKGFKEGGKSGAKAEKKRADELNFAPMKFVFDECEVDNLDFSFGVAEVIIIDGEKYSVETRNINSNIFKCHITEQKTLVIDNSGDVPIRRFFSRGVKKEVRPRVLVTVPTAASVDAVKINLGAGSIVSKDTSLKCETGYINVAAGNLVLDKIFGGKINLRCAMGNLKLVGRLTGQVKIDCGMGNIDLILEGSKDDYSLNARVGLGEVVLNGEKKSGFVGTSSSEKKPNHFNVDCGLGGVHITLTEKLN